MRRSTDTAELSASPVDRDLLEALAAGHVVSAAERLQQADLDDLTRLVAGADLALRRGGPTPDLMDLASRVERDAAAAPVLRWWMSAVIGERSALDLDLAGMRLATAALDEMTERPLAPVAVLWVRGRLRRLAGGLHLADATPDRAAHRRLRAEAIADFTRCGFSHEVAVTRAVTAAAEGLWLWEDPRENLAAAVGAREMLGDDDRSAWAPFLDLLLAALAMGADDPALAARSLAAIERADPLPPLVGAYARHLKVVHDVVTGPMSSSEAVIQTMTDAFAALSRTEPLIVHQMRLLTAQALADMGHGAAAGQLAGPALDMPDVHQVDTIDRHLLASRFRIYAGEDVPIDELTAGLDQLTALGHPSRATGMTWRLVNDLVRVGDAGKADALRAWVPADRQEEPTTDDEDHERDAGAPALPIVRVRLMAPALEVTVAGRQVSLRTTAARLLVALVVAHPDPVHVERAADLLWPDGAWETTRRRLNVVVHRLRQGLGAAGSAVRRTGDMLVLAPAGWDVDLFRARRALAATAPTGADPDRAGDAAAVAAALAEIEGNLCHAQFPYDEHLVDERHAMLGWAQRALGHGDDQAGDPERARVLRALGASAPT
jgi:hypothetical protein